MKISLSNLFIFPFNIVFFVNFKIRTTSIFIVLFIPWFVFLMFPVCYTKVNRVCIFLFIGFRITFIICQNIAKPPFTLLNFSLTNSIRRTSFQKSYLAWLCAPFLFIMVISFNSSPKRFISLEILLVLYFNSIRQYTSPYLTTMYNSLFHL